MEEIKVGEYVKTKYGHIAEVTNVNDFRPPESKYGVEANYFNDVLFLGDEDIVKHSPNIIDLIEEGDYVNEWYVVCVEKHKNRIIVEVNYGKCRLKELKPKDIKSIVTKEQFDSIKYIVGDESSVKD